MAALTLPQMCFGGYLSSFLTSLNCNMISVSSLQWACYSLLKTGKWAGLHFHCKRIDFQLVHPLMDFLPPSVSEHHFQEDQIRFFLLPQWQVWLHQLHKQRYRSQNMQLVWTSISHVVVCSDFQGQARLCVSRCSSWSSCCIWCPYRWHALQSGGGLLFLEPGTHLESGMSPHPKPKTCVVFPLALSF